MHAGPLRRSLVRLTLCCALGVVGLACEKKAPPDPHLARAYQLIHANPQKALEELKLTRNPTGFGALLGRGLAHEGLRDYAKAEELLVAAHRLSAVASAAIPLARVRLMLGKLAQARRAIDAALAKNPVDLSALMLATCLANDESRAQAALRHLESWPKRRTTQAGAQAVPAEYHLARASLFRQLSKGDRAREALSEARHAAFTSDAVAVTLAVVATRAERKDLALGTLQRLLAESRSRTVLRQVALVSHVLGAHTLTTRALALLGDIESDGQLLLVRAEHQFAVQHPQAVKSIRRAIQALREPSVLAKLQLLLAKALLRANSTGEARAELAKLLKSQPEHVEGRLVLAQAQLAEGKRTEALALLRSLAQKGAPLAAHELMARAYLQVGQYGEARDNLEAVLRLAPRRVRALRDLIALDLREGKGRAAMERVERQIQQAPKEPGLRLLLAKLARKMGAGKDAEAALRRGVEVLPDHARLWAALADEQQRRGANAEALATLKEAERKNPQSVLILAATAGLYSRTRQAKQAVAYYQKVLSIAQNDVAALNNIAMFYADELENPTKAVELAERAHRLAPSQPAVTDTLGWALYRRAGDGDLVRARRLLESARDSLASPTSKYHLGLVLIASGAEAAGRELLQKALASSVDFPEAEAARQALEGGS